MHTKDDMMQTIKLVVNL